MKPKTILNILTAALFAVGLGMHFWNSYNDWGIATAKTLHPEVLAQLNDDDGGTTTGGEGETTGGGTTTGGVGTGVDDKINPNLRKKSKMYHYYFDAYADSDDEGVISYAGKPKVKGVKPNSHYKIRVDWSYCIESDNEDDVCDRTKEGYEIPQFWYDPNYTLNTIEDI